MPKKSANASRPKAISKEGTIFKGVSCYVLDNGKRVITKRSIVSALSGNESAKDTKLEQYIDRLPNGSALLTGPTNSEFILPQGGLALGSDAEFVAKVLRLYAEAWGAGALRANQVPVAQRAVTMLAQFAEIGIVALIDEATGYQELRPKDELHQRLLAMIRAEQDDIDPIYKPLLVALARLRKSLYRGIGTPPPWAMQVANVVVTCVWGEEGRLKLRALNPKPTWDHRDTQHFDPEGKKLLVRTLGIAEAYAFSAKSWDHWVNQMQSYFRGYPLQQWMF